MSPEKSEQLVNIYPDLFKDLEDTNNFRLFFFECNDGWFDLLSDCIKEIKEICINNNFDIKVDQIKEKYGSLRFYVSAANDDIFRAIDRAENRSQKTCEMCGLSGTIEAKGGYWLQCLCGICRAK